MKNKHSKKLIIPLLILLLILIVVFFLVCRMLKDKSDNVNGEKTAEALKIDDSQTDEEKEDRTFITSPNIILPGFSELTVSLNDGSVYPFSALNNPADNLFYNCPRCGALLTDLRCPRCEKTFKEEEAIANEYYLQFELYLDQYDEPVFTSGLVSPGYRIEQIKPNRKLEVGDYPSSLLIRSFRSDMSTECNCGKLKITLHVTDTV